MEMPTDWSPFELDGRFFEWSAFRTEPSRTRGQQVLVVVRRRNAQNGPAMVYPSGTVPTLSHAIETARTFWPQLSGERRMLESPTDFDDMYLANEDLRAQSGFTGSAERWEAARRLITEGIDGPGTFLDVGCANGLLMECIAAWSGHHVEPHGVDFAPRLVERARQRLPHWADRIHHADVRTWEPPTLFDFVHARLDLGAVPSLLRLGKRLIVSSDGSFRRLESARAEPVAERLREMGLRVSGEAYRKSDEHQVEIVVAWVDATRA